LHQMTYFSGIDFLGGHIVMTANFPNLNPKTSCETRFLDFENFHPKTLYNGNVHL